MTRKYNFAPGPSTLPLSVLEEVKDEILEYGDTGISMFEHSHRGAAYMDVHERIKARLRTLYSIPDSHELLFMQGGARTHFALIPMNFLGNGVASIVDTGVWSAGAYREAAKIGPAEIVASGMEDEKYIRIPQEVTAAPESAYLHITTNNTVMGTQFQTYPTCDVPLIADMSSDILSQKIDISHFGMIYAGAQKNLGIAGITILIIEKSLLETADRTLPQLLSYRDVLEKDSLANTIPVVPMYVLDKVLGWIENEGGLSVIEARNEKKAALLYGLIDEFPDTYSSFVEPTSRSKMNVVFDLPNDEIRARFLAEAESRDLVGLKGHRLVGGIRASIYNAQTLDATQRLATLMREFATR